MKETPEFSQPQAQSLSLIDPALTQSRPGSFEPTIFKFAVSLDPPLVGPEDDSLMTQGRIMITTSSASARYGPGPLVLRLRTQTARAALPVTLGRPLPAQFKWRCGRDGA